MLAVFLPATKAAPRLEASVSMSDPPVNIRAHQDAAEFEFVWSSDRTDRIGYKALRGECPCAACVDEITGERILDINSIPADIHPASMEFAGNYALKIRWSDGHDTGLFTWDNLNRIGAQFSRE